MNKATVKSFVKGFMGVITGDDVLVKSEKAFRQVQSALSTHISNFNGDTISFEDKIEEAKEKLKMARYNNGEFTMNRDTYIKNLLAAKNDVTKAEEDLEKHLAKIQFLKDELASHETEVNVD